MQPPLPFPAHTHILHHHHTTITPSPCVVLVPVSKCAAGKRFVAANNGDPATCEACTSGTFNANDDASTECAKHNACADTTVQEAGTASKDAVCNPGMLVCKHAHTRRTYMCLSLRAQKDCFDTADAVLCLCTSGTSFCPLPRPPHAYTHISPPPPPLHRALSWCQSQSALRARNWFRRTVQMRQNAKRVPKARSLPNMTPAS